MIISKYGLDFRLLTETDLEMVRNWRNRPRVRSHMQFQDEISPEQQQAWFNSLDAWKNVYWIFSKDGTDIGLVHIKDIENGLGEPGIFTGLDDFLVTPVPALAIMVMMDIAFGILKLDRLKAKIQVNNDHNLWTNLRFGYSPDNVDVGDGFEYYSVDPIGFSERTNSIRAPFEKRYGSTTRVEVDEFPIGILGQALKELSTEQNPEMLFR